VDNRKHVVQNFDPASHDDAVTVDGLEDLFLWASEVVTDANDPRVRRTKEHKLRRNVLEMIQHTKEIEAKEKYADEVACLHRRVIALLQATAEKTEENSALKQIVLTQFMAMSRFANVQEELKQLQSLTWYREEAEAERKHLMDALSKIKKERDYIDEVLCAAEDENTRLAKLYSNVVAELEVLKNRRWWHRFLPVLQKLTNS